MSGQLQSHRSVIAQVVMCIFLTLGPTLTRSENSVYEKKIYGNWQVRQNQRYCRQVLYCKFREANCTQVTTANAWMCNTINAEIAEKGCVMRFCKTDLKMVCSATSPGLEYQVTISDSCPLREQCYVKVTPQTTTPVPLGTSPATLTPGASTSPPAAASTTSPVSGPPGATTSSAQNGAARPATTEPDEATTRVPGATTAPVPRATTAPLSGAFTAAVPWAATAAPLPGATTAAVPGATIAAPLPGATTAAVPGAATTAPLPGATTAAVPGAAAAPDATTTASSVTTLQVSGAATAAAAGTTTMSRPADPVIPDGNVDESGSPG